MTEPRDAGNAVVIGVLTWRGEDLTRECLRSLIATSRSKRSVVVVDNGSGTGEGERLAAEFGVASLTLPVNGGVPAGYNAAIRWAREQGATHVLLANNDLTFPHPDLVWRLMAHAAADVAGVGPIVRQADGSISSAGFRVHRWIGHAERTHSPWASGPYEVASLDGSCMLVSIDAMCRIGGLSPEFFLYWEETDWCARARRAGLRLIVDPQTAVTHVGLGSGNLRQTRRYALRNSLLFARRNIRGLASVTAGVAWLTGRLPFFVMRRLVERANPASVAADAAWALKFHARDIVRNGWHRSAEGPDMCS